MRRKEGGRRMRIMLRMMRMENALDGARHLLVLLLLLLGDDLGHVLLGLLLEAVLGRLGLLGRVSENEDDAEADDEDGNEAAEDEDEDKKDEDEEKEKGKKRKRRRTERGEGRAKIEVAG